MPISRSAGGELPSWELVRSLSPATRVEAGPKTHSVPGQVDSEARVMRETRVMQDGGMGPQPMKRMHPATTFTSLQQKEALSRSQYRTVEEIGVVFKKKSSKKILLDQK